MAEYNPSKIIKDGNTYNFRDTTKIPLAGSNQISGSLIPSADGTVNLGGPSYQWNNAYIKSLTISNTVRGTGGLTLQSKSGTSRILLRDNNSSGFPSSVNLYSKIGDNQEYGVFLNGNVFYPIVSDEMILGYTQRRWADVATVLLNGINPGALSLPSMSYISLDTTSFDVTATTIGRFTSTVDGWVILSMSQKNKPFGIWILQGSYRETFHSVYHEGNYLIFALIPVWTNLNLTIYCTADDIDSTRKIDWLRLFPCQGNV